MSETRVRVRDYPCPDVIDLGYYERNWPLGSSNWINKTNYTDYVPANNGRTYLGYDRVVDELHPPPYRQGGPFEKWAISDGGLIPMNGGTYYSTAGDYRAVIPGFICSFTPAAISTYMAANGGFFPPSSTGMTRLAASDFGDVSQYGPEAWAKFKPGQPAADLALFLAELHEAPRMLRNTAGVFFTDWMRMRPKTRNRKVIREFGNQWLNANFGWRPFINDLRKFYTTWKSLDQRLEQIKRDNGQWVKRTGSVRVAESNDIVRTWTNQSAHLPNLGYKFAANGSFIRLIAATRQDVWFSGRFKYYIPDCGSVAWKGRAVAHLFGAFPTPDLIYELTPWSWLIDWCSNLGANVKNMDNGWASNLAAKYAYVMGTTTRLARIHSRYCIYSRTLDAIWDYALQRKSRVEASPFGFSLDTDGFNPYQWSILSALGLSRLSYTR